MKLNPDCIRDILLVVEEHSDFLHATEFKYRVAGFESLNKYSVEEIAYHAKQCEMSQLIYNVSFYDCGNSIDIRDLTPKGHEFLANIRSDTIWNDVKEISVKVGTKSLSALSQIASGVIGALIRNQLGI
ncbi:MAG: DUF2513 domain-containing protein [Hungatella sp.]|nr:DUF2513 domain-containing protein [Hungatella sp.]